MRPPERSRTTNNAPRREIAEEGLTISLSYRDVFLLLLGRELPVEGEGWIKLRCEVAYEAFNMKAPAADAPKV